MKPVMLLAVAAKAVPVTAVAERAGVAKEEAAGARPAPAPTELGVGLSGLAGKMLAALMRTVLVLVVLR